MSLRPTLGRLGTGLLGAGVAWVGGRRVIGTSVALPGWERANHRGEAVTLLEGPLLVAGAVAGLLVAPGLTVRSRLSALTAVTVAGAFGAYDDRLDLRASHASPTRGFRGHLGALRTGQVTSGAVKIAGIGASGLVAGALLRPQGSSVAQRVAAGAVVAGTANLVNLLDLRPGRALKAGLLVGGHLGVRPGAGGAIVAGGLGAAAALLPGDLSEQSMLGDCGANALGALVGCGLAAWAEPPALYAALLGILALTAASERVSFSRVIDSTPGLRELDRLGRRPE